MKNLQPEWKGSANQKFHLAMACLVIVACSNCLQAQSGRVPNRKPQDNPGNQKTDGQDDPVRLRTDEVLLPVSVRSSDGKVPTYLEKQDFIVSEDGKRQQITSVLRLPANVLFIIDMSGEPNLRKDNSINSEIAVNMVKALGQEDQAAVLSYADKVDLVASWTSDKTAIGAALKAKVKPGIQADYYRALLYAAKEVLPKVTGRRTVVLLSDGVDSFSTNEFSQALAALHRARATVYVVNQNAFMIKELRARVFHKLSWYEMLDPKVRKRYEPIRNYVRQLEAAQLTLKGLAEETGGLVWDSEKRIEVQGAKTAKPEYLEEKDRPVTCDVLASKVVEEIGTEFVVAYSADRRNSDRDFHGIKVYLTRPDIKVRTRRGVYPNVEKGSGVESQESTVKKPKP
jgi:VWFA-related protein